MDRSFKQGMKVIRVYLQRVWVFFYAICQLKKEKMYAG